MTSKEQFIEINRLGIKRKLLISEIGGKTNWHTIQNYFDNNPKMNPIKRETLSNSINNVIKKYR